MKDFLKITIGRFSCTTETEATITYGDRGRRRVTVGQLVDCWVKQHPGPLLDPEPEPDSQVVPDKPSLGRFTTIHEKTQKIIPAKAAEPIDTDAAIAEIHAIKKRLADIVFGMAPGTKLTISVSKEPA